MSCKDNMAILKKLFVLLTI